METNDKKHYIEFKTSDDNGPVIVQIQKDCSQITRSELAQSFRSEAEVKVLKPGLDNLKTIEKILL